MEVPNPPTVSRWDICPAAGLPGVQPYRFHIGFRVDDMDAAADELKAKGVNFLQEPTQIRPGVRIAYIEAPDKVRIELCERINV